MLATYSILLVFLSLVTSSYTIANFPLRRNYYKSLSNPSICMEILHFYPTGPISLYGIFNYTRLSTLHKNVTKKINSKYTFNRVNNPCETSVMFTTFDDDFQRINIRMTLSLSGNKIEFSTFSYKFYKGFRSRIYELWDTKKLFGMRVKVLNETQKHIGASKILEGINELNKKSIMTKNNALCIITENNLATVLKIDDEFINSPGFIFGLKAWAFRDNKILAVRSYDAFACFKDDVYPDVPVVFITDEDNLKIIFEILYEFFSINQRIYTGFRVEEQKRIDIPNILFDNVHNLKNI